MTQQKRPSSVPSRRVPNTQAGVPTRQDQNRTSLDNPDRTGRPRDEGADRLERSGPQPARPEAPGILPSDIAADDRETL